MGILAALYAALRSWLPATVYYRQFPREQDVIDTEERLRVY